MVAFPQLPARPVVQTGSLGEHSGLCGGRQHARKFNYGSCWAAAFLGASTTAATLRRCSALPASLRPTRRRRAGPVPRSRRAALAERDVAKIDSSPDELFYLLPRLGVKHVDDSFLAQLTELYRLLVRPGGDVLDLCSQHDSHLPPEVEYNSLTVHGMNYVELLANPRATERFTRNFNAEPSLANLADDSFDAVLMTVSIQYMQNPVDVLREAKRVLRPGGVMIVSFSNRMFFQKAIEIWRARRTMSGLADLVLGYFREAGLDAVRAANGVRLPEERQPKDWLRENLPEPPTGWLQKDPFIAVVGYKGSVQDEEQKAFGDLGAVSWLPMSGSGSVW